MSRYFDDKTLRRLSLEVIDAQSERQESEISKLAREISNQQRKRNDGAKRRTTNVNLAGTRGRESRTGTLAAYLAEDGQRQAQRMSASQTARGRGSLPGTSQGAAPLTASSFGGVHGYRNITPVRQERPAALRRIASGTDAAVSGLLGGIGSAVETGRAALSGEADFLSDVGLKGFLTTPVNQLGEKRQEPKYQRQMDMGSTAAKLMERAAQKTQETTEGLGPKGAWAAENLISAGQNLPSMAASMIPVVGPAIGGGIMAASAGGSRAYELQQQGADAGEAFWRGTVSGGIELATEKFSIDNFLQIAKGTGARTAVKNLLRQAGVEASEESASYALNYIADKAARDPHAEFSLAELANSAAGGAFSGGIYGGVGLGINAFATPGQARTETQSDAVRQDAAQALPARPQVPGNTGNAVALGTRENGAQAQRQGINVPALQTEQSSYADSLGEHGRQSLSWLQERTGRNDPDFLADHKTGYELGRNGTSEEHFRQMGLAGTLSRDDLYSAFSAGHNDGLAEASEAVRRLSGGEAVSDAALDRALAFPETRQQIEQQVGRLPGVNSQDKAAIRSWAEKQAAKPGLVRNRFSTGLDVKTAERVDRIAKRAGVSVVFSDQLGDAAGAYQDGKITLRTGTENPEMKVLVHELTHHLETSGDYQALSDLIVRHIEQDMGVDFGTLTQQQIDEYAQFGDTLTEDGARRELVAKFAEDYLFTDERSIQRLARENRSLVQKVRDWLHDFVEKFTGSREDRQTARFLKEAEKLYEKALNRAEGRQTGETQHLFVRADNTAKAEQMERGGADRDTIWRETGLIRDTKGNWLREIDDSGSRFYEYGEAQLYRKEGYRRLQELQERELIGDSLSSEEQSEMERLDEIYSGETAREKTRLSDYLRHDELEKLPSRLRNTKLEFRPLNDGASGYYDRGADTIVLNETYRGMERSERRTLLHEIQHVLQTEEGRPGGVSPKYWRSVTQSGDVNRLYLNTAGEIEARETADRADLTAEERRRKMPDLGWERAVFAEGHRAGETQEEIVSLLDGRKYVKADRQVIHGEDSQQWLKQAEKFINEKIRNGDDLTVFSADGNEIQITERSAYKLTDSHVQSIRKADRAELTGEKRALKSRIAGHIDEVIQTAKKFKSRPDVNGKHQNDIGEDGFNYYAAYFEDTDGQYYRVILSSGLNAGKETAYSIGLMDKRKHPAITGSSAKNGGAQSAAALSKNIITQSETGGKQNIDDNQKSQGASFKELERRAEVIDYLRGQMKRTKGLKADPKQVKTLAGELLNEYSSDYDKAEFSAALQTLYDSFANRTDVDAFSEMRQQARELARGVLEESSVLNDETARDYSQLREYLKKTPLTLSEADKADVPGGFGDFRKAHMGRLRLTNNGLAVDSAYMELNADFGEALFPADITHPADQLAQIADVLDALEPVYENPFSRNMEEAASGLADDMIARLFKVQQAKPTFADRQAAKLEKLELQKDWLRAKDLHEQKKQSDAKIEKLMEENRQRVKKAVEKEREMRDKKLSDLKEKHKEQDANRRDKTSRAELRRRIERHAGKLSKKLLNPTDTQHVPEELRGAVAALLDQINLETAVQVDPVTGKRSRYQRDPETGKYKTRTVFDAETGKAHTEYVPLENGDLTKRTEAFRKLREEYKKIMKESVEMVIDPDLPVNLDTAAGYSEKRLEDMSLEELQTVWDVLRAAEASISRAGKLLRAGRFKTIQGIGAAFEKEGRRRAKDRIRFSGVLDTVDSSLNIDMMKPWAYFYTLGEGGEAVYDSFREAQDQKIRDLKVIQDFSQKLRGDTNIDEWTGRGAKTTIFETSGGKIEMTPAQVMSLYKLMQRPQAQEHIKEGGIRPTAIQRGVIERTAGAPVKVTIEDVTKIVSTLTDEQKRIADGFGEFMSGTLADWGNETSMALYGYKKFREENYFPIQSDKNQVKEELGQEGLDMRVKQKGWTKATVKGANNAVMIDDIFDVFAKHADEMSTYHSSLSALEDASRVFNFKYIDANGKPNGSVKDTIDSILGKHGQDYYRKLFNDLNGGIRSEGSSWLFGNFKAAAVGGNMRVVMQQPTAYARAYAEMDLKYLLGGLLRRGDFQEMIEHSPIAQWKAWGYNQTDLGRPIKDIFIDQRNPLRKFTDAMMKPAEVMDNLTWTRLWNACKLEIQDTTTLEKGSDAYWKAVAKRFDKVIDRTQVVDSVLQRSQMMRSTNGLTRMSTSFMAEPTTSYNLLHVAGVDAIQRKPNAGKKFARVTMAVLLGSAATALAAALADAARSAGDDDDDKNFWERYKEAAAENFVDQINPAGLHPVLKDVLSLLQGYDVKRTDMTLIADVVQASRTLFRAQSGEGKVTVPAALAELLLKCSKVFGLPVANIKRDVAAIMNTTLEGLQAAGVNTYGVRFRWDMFKTAQNESTAAWWMNQAFAARDSGDSETAERIFQMLHDKELKTREEIRDYEKNVWNKDKNELVKLAFEAQADGDDEGFQMYTDALRGMGLDDEEIEKALGGKEDKARRDEFGFRDYRSDIKVRIQDEAYESPAYETLDKEHRESFESAVKTYSSNVTKDAKIEDFDIDSKWVIACRDAQKECGLSESKFIVAYAATIGVKSLKDRDGESIANSASLLKMQAIYQLPGLNDKQRAYLFEACGVGKNVRHYNKAKVEQELKKMEKQAAK